MTSNLGSEAFSGRHRTGFYPQTAEEMQQARAQEHIPKQVEKELRDALTLEFLNRIDAITVFKPLSDEALATIAGLMLARIPITVKATPAAVRHLVGTGRDPALGARPLRRAIEDLVKDPLAERLICGKIAETDTVTLGCRGDKLTFRKKRRCGGGAPQPASPKAGLAPARAERSRARAEANLPQPQDQTA
jgi:ATP-dependent Clp protease ATP-binding subunit ClpC